MSRFKNLIVAAIICLLLLQVYSVIDRTYYRYLGITISADNSQIQQAYQSKLHKINTEESQQQKTRKIPLLQTAYNTLINPQQREKYDRYGKDYLKNNVKQVTSLNSYSGQYIFSSISSDYRKGATIKLKIPVSIQDLYNGTTVKALFETSQACQKCMGTGADSLKSIRNCGACGGKGFSYVQGRNMYGQPQQFENVCHQCQGSGKFVTKQCPSCHGSKIIKKLKQIEIQIPAKFHGKELKLKNYGPEQQIGAPSDFSIQIQQIASKQWRKSGQNLFYTLQISFEQAIFGFQKKITHLSGEQMVIKRNEITTKQTRLTFAGKGFSSNGRLTVQFKINIPNFTDRQLDMWEDFFRKYNL